MNLKKGQSMSMNTIIIAALALIVLVVLIVIFTGRINIFGSKSNEAANSISSSEESCKLPGVRWCTLQSECSSGKWTRDIKDCQDKTGGDYGCCVY